MFYNNYGPYTYKHFNIDGETYITISNQVSNESIQDVSSEVSECVYNNYKQAIMLYYHIGVN